MENVLWAKLFFVCNHIIIIIIKTIIITIIVVRLYV